MAYKRYVHKEGKRHGPYYYKNVRDESGMVRNIYLGKVTSRGKRSLEVAIVFLTVLLIIISALFFIQNRNLVLSKIAAEGAKVPFEVDQILIKVLVKEKEFIEKEIRVMNVHEEEQTIRIETKEISHLIDVLDKEFTIKPGQTKIARLNFSSFDFKNKIEQAPGVYIGKVVAKTDSYEKEVPVVVEIESKNVLFDMNLNPVARDRTVTQGSSTTFEVRVFNLQSIESFNIDMDFFVKDINGNTIVSERESVVVQTQASFFKTLKIPEKLKTGNYVFVAQASLGNSVGTASYLFEVEEIAEERQFSRFLAFCRNDPLCWVLSVIVLLLLFAIGAYSYFFIGVFIYKKLFGITIPSRKIEMPYEKRKENVLVESFHDVAAWWGKSREAGLRRKLKEDELRLQIREKESKLKDEGVLDKENSKIIAECRKLVDKGYKALEKGNIVKAQKVYFKLMDSYMDLPGKIKIEIFKDINSFYKNMLLKKQQLKQYGGEIKGKAEEERIRKQKEKEQKSKRMQGLKDLTEEKESSIKKLRDKIAEAYSANKAIAKEISSIEKDIYGLNNEKKILYGMYNESVAGRKEHAKEHESKIAEWEERHEAKLKEKNSIKNEIKQEYENELKELENELSKLSEKERKEEEKWKKLELKAKYKLEEHEREKSVNEEIKSQLEEKREMEHEYNKKKQSLGKGVAGREILEKQKELNDHIRGHEKDIQELKKKIDENEKALERYNNEIGGLVKEKEKAEDKLWEARKEVGGLGYIASFFMPRKKKDEKPVKQIESGKKALQKKADEVKAKIAEPKHEITKEEVEKEETKEEEEKKELQNTLRSLQITTKQIKHKENAIEKLTQEKKEKRKEAKKKVFSFFHSLGLVKTEKEKQETTKKRGEEIKQRELEKKKQQEEKEKQKALGEERKQEEQRKKEEESRKSQEEKRRKLELEEQKKKELERKRQEEEKKKQEELKRKELERKRQEEEKKKQEELKRKELEGKKSEKEDGKGGIGAEKKTGILDKLFKGKEVKELSEKEEAHIEIRRKLAGKSRLFEKCYKLMLEANDALQKDDFGKAKNLYLKTRELYIKLEYHEKKEVYNALNTLYNLLKK